MNRPIQDALGKRRQNNPYVYVLEGHHDAVYTSLYAAADAVLSKLGWKQEWLDDAGDGEWNDDGDEWSLYYARKNGRYDLTIHRVELKG